MRRKLAAGNWKMNGTAASLAEVEALTGAHPSPNCEMLLCPPATLIARMAEAARGSVLAIGGQDCHSETSGAHTGDISAEMLRDAGASHVILGHSERRADHAETDEMVRAKTQAAFDAGLVAIVCVGETLDERKNGHALDVVGKQLDGSVAEGASGRTLVIAYEPVWAIGTGKVPTLDEIGEVHGFIRERLSRRFGGTTADEIRILYGGSVKASNAKEIFGVADVDGALVGGASLRAADFGGIVEALGTAEA